MTTRATWPDDLSASSILSFLFLIPDFRSANFSQCALPRMQLIFDKHAQPLRNCNQNVVALAL